MQRRGRAVSGLLGIAAASTLIVLWAVPARALRLLTDERIVTSQLRYEEEPGMPWESFVRTPSTPFAPFDVELPTARQESSVALADGGLTMHGSATGEADGYWSSDALVTGGGESRFRITFRVHGEAEVDLSGWISVEYSGGAFVELSSLSGTTIFRRTPDDTFVQTPFSFATILPAGDYAVDLLANGPWTVYENSADFSLDLSVTDSRAIPEPSAFVLAGLGIVGLAHARARQSRRS